MVVPARELHYRFEWRLRSSPEELWPLVADTNRFNRETGAPEVERDAILPAAAGRRNLRLRLLGRSIPFEEAPFEWVRPERFGVLRTYASGPIAALRVLVELTPGGPGGTELVYQVWARPRGLLGRLVIPVAIGRVARRRFAEAFRAYDARVRPEPAEGTRPVAAAVARSRLAPGGGERLAQLREALVEAGENEALVERLAAAVERGDDLDLARLRPYALADSWGAARRRTLELCLRATRAGLLESRWELLCPLCRGAAGSSATLAGVERDVHCDSCGIDFTASFERSVELVFSPNPAVREVERHDYCVGGPQVTPHIVAQQLLAPGERRELQLALEPGAYRLRAAGIDAAQQLTVSAGGAAAAAFTVGEEGWLEAGAADFGPSVALSLANAGAEERLVVAERTAWADDAATAADVTALQAFRDLFSSEALRPGAELGIGSLTIVFTDLRDSTRLYRQIGDAPAFGSVVGHFDVMREAIAAEGGAVVKTIGDAVMAVFRRPVAALQALLGAQLSLARPPEGVRPLQLKVGVHTGPCIAVTLNDRLDYFGSTVNAAARLVGLSRGDDVVISEPVRADPEVAEYLAAQRLELEPLEAELKGFDDARFELWRVRRRG
jgi:class 3 adenylate cyclase